MILFGFHVDLIHPSIHHTQQNVYVFYRVKLKRRNRMCTTFAHPCTPCWQPL